MEHTTTLEKIRRALKPIGSVYQGHPVLSRLAAYSVLKNAPMGQVQSMCHDLGVNVQELTELLERSQVIAVSRPAKRKRREAAKLFD